MRLLPLLLALLMLPAACLHAQDYNDSGIVNRINRAILNSEELQGADILVVSINGYVMLAGQALSDKQKQQASVAAAFASDEIRRLINELEVVDAIDHSFDASDADLIARVHEAIKDMSPQTVLVVHHGIVHLMGQVSREHGTGVANVISKLSGVKSIRLSYEFI